MIRKFSFGNPIATQSVVINLPLEKNFSIGNLETTWPFIWNYELAPEDKIYGLGENMRGINKRGFIYTSWCSDEPHHDESKSSLYGAHNFIIVHGEKDFGLFFDTPSKITYDIAFTKNNQLTVKTDDTGVFLYYITPEENEKNPLLNIVHQFRTLIGQSYIPPLWAFGFQQSRWGYKNEKDILEVVNRYKELNIPLDAVCMDIDYMEEYEDFTVDKSRFPDLAALSKKLKKEGIRLVPIIDAGVKIKKGYSVYDEGIENDYFCKKQDGKTPYAAGVWPGRSHFTDFFNPKARQWFGSKYKILTDQGIEGFWNDMNEPAMFYSDESLKSVYEKLKNTDISNLDVNSFFVFSGLGETTKNSFEDYKLFYHRVPVNPEQESSEYKLYRHDKVHNMYGGLMTKAASEELDKIFNKRTLLYSRASYIGSHRYGGIWTGDVNSWWTHLEQQIKMLPSLNMCGFLYVGSDIGGFSYDTSRDLVLRWTALGVFTPLMRNHSANYTRLQECFRFENPQDFKSLLDFRYALIPYLYSEYIKAAVNNTMLFKPLGFEFTDDKLALETEDQLLLGNEIMIAPVYKQNATGRYVYLPEPMTKVIWENSKAREEPMEKGIHYIEVPLNAIVFFVRNNCLVPMGQTASSTDFLTHKDFTLLGNGKEYKLYQDDGFTKEITLENRISVLKR